jgi:type IV secretory pathway VirB10-like protein
MTTATVDTAQIAETAYHIWLEEGQPEGRDQEHWFAAIARLTPAEAPAKPRKPRATKAKAAAPKAKAADAKAPAKRSRKAAKA